MSRESRSGRPFLHYLDDDAKLVKGSTEPRLFTAPLRELTPETSLGFDAIEFARELLGIHLMPWQEWMLIHLFELRPDGKLRFRTVVIEVARQNGKSLLAQVICLYRLFVDDTRLVLGTAQNLDVAREIWADACELAEASEVLSESISKIQTANGKEQLLIRLDDLPGRSKPQFRRWKVAAANRKGGRGLSADTVLMDELREQQTWDAWSAIKNTTIARANGLVVGISNAGDLTSVVLRERREIGIKELNAGSANGLFSWSAPEDADLDNVYAWAMANPALGFTVDLDSLIDARSDPETSFRTENLCQWVTADVETYFDPDLFRSLIDMGSEVDPTQPLQVAVDVATDRSRTWVAVAGHRDDGLLHTEVIATREGMFWVVPYVKQVLEAIGGDEVALQARGCPASELDLYFKREKVKVRGLGGTELGAATGQFKDAVRDGTLRHRDQPPLNTAISGGIGKRLGNQMVIDRFESKVDVGPLNACLWATYALTNEPLEDEVPPAGSAAVGVFEDPRFDSGADFDLMSVHF